MAACNPLFVQNRHPPPKKKKKKKHLRLHLICILWEVWTFLNSFKAFTQFSIEFDQHNGAAVQVRAFRQTGHCYERVRYTISSPDKCCTVKKKKKKGNRTTARSQPANSRLKKKSLFVCFAYFVSLIKKSYPEFLQNLLTLNYFRRNLLPWWQKNPARLRLARRINLAVSEKF